ncbi:hypothetical protein CNMCM5623_006383 [Aspergillus felis]|uniref:Uncharacterized protein n=1 Tax=Aspergillus felis TaxID=1287682 RepID=A0A8H6PV81_9EURO|nr:hypothetical protein CNMCM5623_006383 [Aspergillus felis]
MTSSSTKPTDSTDSPEDEYDPAKWSALQEDDHEVEYLRTRAVNANRSNKGKAPATAPETNAPLFRSLDQAALNYYREGVPVGTFKRCRRSGSRSQAHQGPGAPQGHQGEGGGGERKKTKMVVIPLSFLAICRLQVTAFKETGDHGSNFLPKSLCIGCTSQIRVQTLPAFPFLKSKGASQDSTVTFTKAEGAGGRIGLTPL